MYQEDLSLNNLQWLICHKTQPNHITVLEKSSVTRKYYTLIHSPCCRRRPAADYGSKQESADYSRMQNNGKRGPLSRTLSIIRR